MGQQRLDIMIRSLAYPVNSWYVFIYIYFRLIGNYKLLVISIDKSKPLADIDQLIY